MLHINLWIISLLRIVPVSKFNCFSLILLGENIIKVIFIKNFLIIPKKNKITDNHRFFQQWRWLYCAAYNIAWQLATNEYWCAINVTFTASIIGKLFISVLSLNLNDAFITFATSVSLLCWKSVLRAQK